MYDVNKKTRQTLGRNDIRGARADTVARLARALGVAVEDLIDLEEGALGE